MNLRRFSLALVPVLALALAACSGGTTAAPTDTGTTPADDASGLASQECQDLASANAQAQGDRVFVEAGGAQYLVDGVRALPGNRVIVATSVDQPDLVGYGQVQFLSECVGEELVLLGGYVPTNGNFELLFTTEEGSAAGDVTMEAP